LKTGISETPRRYPPTCSICAVSLVEESECHTIHNQRVVLLLAGGDKSSQSRDIEKAQAMLNALED
jgi:hypothetical protein